MFELNNFQRKYFGLPPVDPNWERMILKGDARRPDCLLYFDGNRIKRKIISNNNEYEEFQYNEETKQKQVLLPKTKRGKERILTAASLESRHPLGVHCLIDSIGRIYIASFETKTIFYDSGLQEKPVVKSTLSEQVDAFIASVPENHFSEIGIFAKAKRKNVKYTSGDFFAFKIGLNEYGYGRILLDVYQLKKKKLISIQHGLGFFMGRPLLVHVYAYTSENKKVHIEDLSKVGSLPSTYIFDDAVFYGEFEIIGHKKIKEEDLDFPMSFGRHISWHRPCVFLQWGLIHLELPIDTFDQSLLELIPVTKELYAYRFNRYGYYSLGLHPAPDVNEIKSAMENNGHFKYEFSSRIASKFDLRNPINKELKIEIMRTFQLDPEKNYAENCLLTNTANILDLPGIY
jgi:Immunity protein 26